MARHASHTLPKSPASVLNGLVKKGQTDAALALLANLRAQHLLTTVTVNVVIAATGRCYSWSLAAALLQDMRSCSLCLTVVSLNSLLSSMHPFSAWRQAASTVARERALITPDQITHNVLIKTCTEKRRWEAAQAIAMLAMRQGAVQPDQYTCSSLLSCESWPAAQVLLDHVDLDMACFRASIGRGTWQRSLAVVSRMWTLGLRRDGGSFNALFTCLSRWRWAIRGLERHTRPDLLRLNSILDTCTKSGKWGIAVDVYSLMKASRIRPDIVAKNCVIQAMKHLWPCAVGFFLRMMDCRIAPDEASYRAVFETCGPSPQTIPWLMSQMSRESLQQSVVTCSAAINACEPRGFWQIAVWLLSLAVFDEACFGAAISVCEKAQRWKTAFQLLHGVRAHRLRLDAVSISAAVSACETGEDADVWRAPLSLLFRMAEWSIVPNQISYSSAAAACRAHSSDSCWQTTLQVMDDMASSWRLDITSCNLVLGICESHDLVHRIPELLAGIAREFFASVPAESANMGSVAVRLLNMSSESLLETRDCTRQPPSGSGNPTQCTYKGCS